MVVFALKLYFKFDVKGTLVLPNVGKENPMMVMRINNSAILSSGRI